MPQALSTSRRNPYFNPERTLTRDVSRQGQSPSLMEAVVVEIFTDIDIDPAFSKFIKGQVTNPYFVDIAPPNAIIGKISSNAAGLAQTNLVVLFPMFSSHFQLPISVGETVLCMFSGGGITDASGLGFWFDLKRGAKPADDPNYVHYDRIYDPTNIVENYSTSDFNSLGSEIVFDRAIFNNGAEHNGSYTLNQTDPNKNPYNIIVQNSYSNKFSSFEVVPRYNKRPNEFVLQGKNNSMIVFGEDRRGDLRGAFIPDNEDVTDIRGGAAMLDLSVGRGRTDRTAPNIVINERGKPETNKVPFKYGKQQNKQEGDPDFINDAARILLTQNSKVDVNFLLTEQTTPENCYPILQPESTTGKTLVPDNENQNLVTPSSNNSYAVAKADHVRIIARSDNEPGTSADGSILIIREGDLEEKETIEASGVEQEQSKGLSYLLLNNEGVQIQGKLIHLGPARNHAEPAILWSNYIRIINEFNGQINALHRAYGEQVMGLQATILMLCNTLSSIFSSANVCPTGGPNPAITAAAGVLLSVASQISSNNSATAIAQISSDLMQKQQQLLEIAKAENQSKIVFIS